MQVFAVGICRNGLYVLRLQHLGTLVSHLSNTLVWHWEALASVICLALHRPPKPISYSQIHKHDSHSNDSLAKSNSNINTGHLFLHGHICPQGGLLTQELWQELQTQNASHCISLYFLWISKSSTSCSVMIYNNEPYVFLFIQTEVLSTPIKFSVE